MKEPYSNLFQKDWKRRIFSYLVALSWWWKVHLFTEIDQIFLDVPVFIKNIPSGCYLCYEKNHPTRNTNLVLRGKRNKLDQIQSSDLRIVLDISKSSRNYHFHTVTSQEIYMKNISLADGIGLKAIGSPQIHIALAEKIEQIAQVQVILPCSWNQQVLTYAPQKLKQHIRGTSEAIQKQLQIGIFWSIPELTLIKAYEEFLTGKGECGICLKLNPEQRTIHLPALSQEPKTITDPNLSYLYVFFVPQHDHQSIIELPVKASNSFAFKKTRSILPATYTLPFKGISPLFLESARPYLFLNTYWQSETHLNLSLGITDLLQWRKNFVEMYAKLLQPRINLNLTDLKETAKKFFAHYLLCLKLDPCFAEQVENFLQTHSSFAKVVINQ